MVTKVHKRWQHCHQFKNQSYVKYTEVRWTATGMFRTLYSCDRASW